jgi:hypothetical protein
MIPTADKKNQNANKVGPGEAQPLLKDDQPKVVSAPP